MECHYPEVFRDDSQMNDYHGNKVSDPYAWLENPMSEHTKAFVEAQNSVTLPFLEACPVREPFRHRMTELFDFPKYGCPFHRGPRYFHFHNTGLQNQSVMYVQESLSDQPSIFLDPNTFSEDGTVALRGTSFSEDGASLAYGLSASGSDWVQICFLQVVPGKEDTPASALILPDRLNHVKFSCMSWTHDGHGMFYNRYPPPAQSCDGTDTDVYLHQKLYYHVLATEQADDVLCAQFPDHPKWMGSAEVTADGRYVVLSIHEGCEPVNRLWYCDLETLPDGISGELPWVKLIDNFEAEYEYITNEGTLFTFRTNCDAPRYRLITIDLTDAEPSSWRTLVSQHECDVLDWATCVNGSLMPVCWLSHVKNVLQMYDLATGAQLTTFPLDVGSVVGFSGRKKDKEIFFQFTSFLIPGIIYHCDLTKESYEPSVFRTIMVKGFEPTDYDTVQVFYPSEDGTKIPMFLVHKKGIELDGSSPVLLYGYGGFNISITPSYSVSHLIFVRHLGGILAVANIRGGGEYGETWHREGMKEKKNNVFADFICAAQYLVESGYTQPQRLAINGASNGGLLVGACINRRPDLFGCAVAEVGVFDLLKFHRFTIGHAWTTEFGCSEDPDHFPWLVKHSPLHTVNADATYPAVLLLTADHDDRVVPLHSYKFIAELQHVANEYGHSANGRPLLLRVDTKAGHGAGKPTAKVLSEAADVYGFMARTLGLTWQD
uniref:prolyl endopeptidase isoform X2 n=1 Tax=Myxine glutinosa TaxID=7769 RepID=UPI00358F0815